MPINPILYFILTHKVSSYWHVEWETITVHIQDIPLSAGSKRAFYISASGSGKLLIEDIEGDPNTLAADDNIKLLNPTKISPSAFGNLYSGDYAW
jgi:hypothetical protein